MNWLQRNAFEVSVIAVLVLCAAVLALLVGWDAARCEAKGGHLEQTGTVLTFINAGNNTLVPVQIPIMECLR